MTSMNPPARARSSREDRYRPILAIAMRMPGEESHELPGLQEAFCGLSAHRSHRGDKEHPSCSPC
jgi:hypothetical protein